VAIEELHLLNYPNFANSQYVAVQDKVSKIAERPARDRGPPKPSLDGLFGAINLLKTRAIRVINCSPAHQKFR
jgi:hypothetical protein